jgi:hypothetical protein
MEQSPSWEANPFPASQEFPRILWNPKVHYLIHKCPTTVLNQLDPVHTPTSHFLKNHLNIIHPSTPGSAMWSLSPRTHPRCITNFQTHFNNKWYTTYNRLRVSANIKPSPGLLSHTLKKNSKLHKGDTFFRIWHCVSKFYPKKLQVHNLCGQAIIQSRWLMGNSTCRQWSTKNKKYNPNLVSV